MSDKLRLNLGCTQSWDFLGFNSNIFFHIQRLDFSRLNLYSHGQLKSNSSNFSSLGAQRMFASWRVSFLEPPTIGKYSVCKISCCIHYWTTRTLCLVFHTQTNTQRRKWGMPCIWSLLSQLGQSVSLPHRPHMKLLLHLPPVPHWECLHPP